MFFFSPDGSDILFICWLKRAKLSDKKIQRTAGPYAIKTVKICAPKNKKRNFADLSS